MSRPEVILCDRCGKEIPVFCAKDNSAKIHLWGLGVNRYSHEQRIDFCAECYEQFVNFLECSERYHDITEEEDGSD